jgi:glutathione S-transferase
MTTLYGVYRSRATRPLWLLGETGMPFTHVPVIQGYRLADPSAADAPLNTDSPAFRAINPMGQVPVLDDDGLILTESMAMTLYLARKAGGPVGPGDAREDAAFENWAFFAATAVEPGAVEILFAGRTADPAKAADAGAAMLARPFARLEAQLAGRDWIAERFSVADIMVAECVRYAAGHAGLMAAHPAVSVWLARCHARPAFAAMMERRNAEPA